MIKGKTTYYLFSMAMAACLTAFSACSADETVVEEAVPVNPTYDGHAVKTRFVIHIPHSSTGKRMTAANTQNDNGFLGINHIYLAAMRIPTGGITATSSISERFTLADIASDDSDITGGQGGQKIYKDINIAVGTSHFLFYGQAPDATDGTTSIDRNFARGVLSHNLADNSTQIATPGDIRFSLVPVAPQTTGEESLQTLLNSVIQTQDWKATADAPTTEEDVVLSTLYQNLTALTAGSARAIKITLEDLYNALAPIIPSPTAAGDIARNIRQNITDALFVAQDEDGDGTFTLDFQAGIDERVREFPVADGLPEGAVKLYFSDADGTPAFSYVPTTHIGTDDDHVDVSSITYPPRLSYYAATPIKASHEADPVSWGWDNGWDGWDDIVTASTRTIALEEKINYGVADMQTTAKFNSNSMKDARPETHYITINENEFRLTGILVGGQPTTLQYDMTPAEDATFTQTLYDRDIPGGSLPVTVNSYTDPNHTLVLDNKNAVNPAVNFAIEMENGSASTIYGVDGIIKPGMRFYLVGQLDPSATDGSAIKPGNADEVDHVFVQDHTTTVQVTISSFEHAYVTIPDLRSTQLELGLYVDVKWQQGYTQDATIP